MLSNKMEQSTSISSCSRNPGSFLPCYCITFSSIHGSNGGRELLGTGSLTAVFMILFLSVFPFSCDVEARAPDETGMEQVLSDLQALKGLYGLLHRGQQANENVSMHQV